MGNLYDSCFKSFRFNQFLFITAQESGAGEGDFLHRVGAPHPQNRIGGEHSIEDDIEESGMRQRFGDDLLRAANGAAVSAGEFAEERVKHSQAGLSASERITSPCSRHCGRKFKRLLRAQSA